ARRRLAGLAMIDRIDQHAHAQHVGGHDEFLSLLRAHLPGPGQPVDRGRPLRLRRLDVAHEAVEMLDQRLHDLPQAGIGNLLPALKHHIGEVLFGHIGHGRLLESVLFESFWRDLLANAIARGRYFLAAEATGASASFPLADTAFDTSFSSGCSIRFRLLKAWLT